MIPILFFSYHQISAQEKTSLFLLLGGGLTSERGDASPYSDTKYTKIHKFSFSFGLGLTHSFSDHFSIEGRLLSEAKGWNGRTDYDSIIYDANWNPTYKYLYSKESNVSVSYFTLSIIPKYVYKRFSVGIGAFVGTPYSSVTRLKYFDLPPYLQPPPGASLTTHYNSIGDFKKFDSGLVFNFGYSVSVKDFLFNFQLVNNLGLSNVFQPNHSLPVLPNPPSLHTNTYLLMIGVSRKTTNRKLFHHQT